MNKNYDELSSEEKEALIELCKDDPATFIETVLGIELLEYQKVYVRETFEALKKQDKFDWRAHYFGEPYKCKVCGGTGEIPYIIARADGPDIREFKKCPACNRSRIENGFRTL